MELNSAQTNTAIYALSRQIVVLSAELGVIKAALTKAGIVLPEHLDAAAQQARDQYQTVFERMKSFPLASSAEAIESVEAYLNFVERK